MARKNAMASAYSTVRAGGWRGSRNARGARGGHCLYLWVMGSLEKRVAPQGRVI